MANVQEIWKDVPGFENYQASTFGRIRSKDHSVRRAYNSVFYLKGTVLKQRRQKHNTGIYAACCLYNNGKQKMCSVHRLVAATFIPNPENKPQVNHIDLNPFNNDVRNLEWVTAKENMQHFLKSNNGKSNKIMSDREKEILRKANSKPIYLLNIVNNEKLFFDSAYEASKYLGLRKKTVHAALKGNHNTGKIYKPFYVE